MKTGKVILGVLVSFAAGATMGILFAPEKGARTRRKIMNKSEDYSEALKDRFEELVETISDKYERSWQEADNFFKKGKTNNDSAKQDAKSIMA